ncbi:MAG: winged helix-turn-helix domain-containing protein [Elusimicrobiota bacterium]
MKEGIEAASARILEALRVTPSGELETMQLKLQMGVSAGKLFMALGWLLKEGSIELTPSDFGYTIKNTWRAEEIQQEQKIQV